MELSTDLLIWGLGLVSAAVGYSFKMIINNDKKLEVLDARYDTRANAQDKVIQGINDQLKDIRKDFNDVREEMAVDRKDHSAALINIYQTLNEIKQERK